MKIEISKCGVFSRQATLAPISALPELYCLQFESKFGSAKDPQRVQRNFEATISRDDVPALNNTMTEVLSNS